MESQGRVKHCCLGSWLRKRERARERETDNGFAIVTAVLMSVPDRQQGMDDINCTIQNECAYRGKYIYSRITPSVYHPPKCFIIESEHPHIHTHIYTLFLLNSNGVFTDSKAEQ